LRHGSEEPLETDMDEDGIGENAAPYQTGFEGVVKILRRWYTTSTTPESIRDCAEYYMKLHPCEDCNDTRLNKESLWIQANGKNISELSNFDLDELVSWFKDIEKKMSDRQRAIARDVLTEIRDRLQFLLDVGLNYLTLNRPSGSLSGGEYQ